LKPNIFWSDGRPITAQDYQFTQEKMMDPAVNYPFRSLRQQIRSMRAIDDRTLVAELSEVFCPALLTVGSTNPIPKHVFETLDINDNPFNLRPQVGSGPFLVREWNRGSFIEFVANERFYLGRPNLDRWVTKIVPNQTVQYSQYKTGEIDTCSPVLPQDWEEAKQLPNTQAFEFYAVPGSWDYIQFNLRLPMFQDLRVRQAFAAATNRQAMIDRVMRGLARPVNSIYTESSWAWNRNIRGVEFNIQRANQLLDEAGWRRPANDPNGIRVNAQGQPLRMRIFYNTGNQIREAVATIVQQSYRQIGADIEIIAEDFTAYLNRVNTTRDFELSILGWATSLEPNGMRNVWSTNNPQNSTGYSNPRVDQLFVQAAAGPQCSNEARKVFYDEIQEIISRDQPYIFLWERATLAVVNSRIVVNPLLKTGYGYRPWEWYSTTGR
ncbi:MAG: ABC transporter substrate-binding protein, partial [Dehalococcoidia bacterium]|nr:ABC transporter substrate-binding protein [Dehalococcoidia bacterium]